MDSSTDDFLEKALSAAFALAEGDEVPRVIGGQELLRGLSATKVPERVGRYHVEALVGRGGIGVVLKARDAEIGRSVAIKLLHEHHASDAEMIRRFEEEARVGGGLEHPGVVPVHEMGRCEDGRPFFTMKLVEGETFASVLAARAEPSADRAHFLSRFERICQIVAYAHARGVVHRDLKPSNVLVGAFGEILVMDWGFATQVDAAPQEGNRARIVGTPAYMAPEQARGEVEKIGVRSDVFALGAILCEILTGKPPYDAESASEALLFASRSWLEEAWKRLDASGADPRMIELARQCLARESKDRPADAGAVAAEVEAYLRSLEAKARDLAIEAAEARARADSERRQRKLTLALAIAIGLALCVGGLAYLWLERARSQRLAEDDRLVTGMEERVKLLAERARNAPEPSSALWDEPVAMADRAAMIARERDLPDPVQRRLSEVFASVRDEQALVSANAKFVEELHAIHERVGDARDAARRDQDYALAFRRGGIDLDALPRDEAVALIRGSQIRKDLVTALDDWIFSRRSSVQPGDAAHLIAVVNGVDPDGWRVRVREAAMDRSIEALLALARSEDLEVQDPESHVLLAHSLRRIGRREAAVMVLERAQFRHPGDYELHHQLGILLRDGPKEQLSMAIRHFAMALAVRPKSAHAMVDLAQALLISEQFLHAGRHLDAALRLDPRYAPALYFRGMVHYQVDEFSPAVELFRLCLASDPGFSTGYLGLGLATRDAGRSAEAEAAFRELVQRDPAAAEAWVEIANALLAQGRLLEAKEAYERCHEVGSARGSRWTQPSMAWLADIERLIEAEGELRGQPFPPPTIDDPERAVLFGRAAGYAGRHRTAARILEQVVGMDEGSDQNQAHWRVLAARAAAAAGTGAGVEEVPLAERERWRSLALSWLTQIIDSVELPLPEDDASRNDGVLMMIRRDPAFAKLRPGESPEGFSAAEAGSWKALWSRVRKLSKDGASR